MEPDLQTPPERAAYDYNSPAGKAYWRKNITLIIGLLVVWALVSFVAGILLAEPLADINFFSVPLSFWFAHQGSIVVFVILIFVYARWMDRIDKEFDVHE